MRLAIEYVALFFALGEISDDHLQRNRRIWPRVSGRLKPFALTAKDVHLPSCTCIVPLSPSPAPQYWNQDITKPATLEFASALITLPLHRSFYICLSTCIRPLIPLLFFSLTSHTHSPNSLSIIVSIFPPPHPERISFWLLRLHATGFFFLPLSPLLSISSRLYRPASIL